jgi:hypothetical protein
MSNLVWKQTVIAKNVKRKKLKHRIAATGTTK